VGRGYMIKTLIQKTLQKKIIFWGQITRLSFG